MNTSLIPKLKPEDAPELQRFVDNGASRTSTLDAHRDGQEIPGWRCENNKIAMCAKNAQRILLRPKEDWSDELSLDHYSRDVRHVVGRGQGSGPIEFIGFRDTQRSWGLAVEDLELIAECYGVSNIDDLTIVATDDERPFPIMVEGEDVLVVIAPLT